MLFKIIIRWDENNNNLPDQSIINQENFKKSEKEPSFLNEMNYDTFGKSNENFSSKEQQKKIQTYCDDKTKPREYQNIKQK